MKASLILLNIFLLGIGCSHSYAQIITTVAGTNMVSGYSGDGGPSTAALIDNPRGVAIDSAGNVYIADHFNFVIRKISTNGIITTVAGNGTSGNSGDGGPATSAQLYYPIAVAVDKAGNLYIAEDDGAVVRKVNTAGIISTYAGSFFNQGYSGDGGPAAAARLYTPRSIAVDPAGNVYIFDGLNYNIRKVNPAGIISTFVPSGTLYNRASLATDNSGNLYIADPTHSVVRKVTPAGVMTTIAGTGAYGTSGDGGPATSAQLGFPSGVTIDNAGNIYISDEGTSTIRKIDPAGIITRFALAGGANYSGDGGPALAATMWIPQGITTDNAGHFYVADSYNHTIRKITECIAVVFNQQPSDKTICENSNTSFSANSLNADAYQWQVNTGTGWNSITNNSTYSGATTNTLVIGSATASMNNYQYRCTGANACSITNSYSAVASLTVITAPSVAITASASNICPGSFAGFTATVTNGGSNPVYQWQVNDGSGWNNIINNSTYTGATANVLIVNSVIASMNNYQYRCQVNNTCNNYYSTPATLTIVAASTVTISTLPNSVCPGGPVTITATITNGGTAPAYQWQVNTGSGWTNLANGGVYSGATTNTLAISQATASMNNYQYRCVGANSCSNSNSAATTLTVIAPPAIAITKPAFNICSGRSFTFTATVTNEGTNPAYQWQVNDGTGWSNISDNGTYSGAATNTLTIIKTDVVMSNYQYRCVFINSCGTIYSISESLIVTQTLTPTITIAASATDICSGTAVTFTATITNGGTKPAYQWQVNGVNTGPNSNTYTNSNLANGDVISCLLTSSLTCSVPVASGSNIVMTVNPLPVVSVTADTTIKKGSIVQLNASATGVIDNYLWMPATDLSDQHIANPGTKPVNTITYQVSATTANGCTGYGKVTITVIKKIVMPNAFTPNGDGKNDVFRIPPSITFSLTTFSIFNRWGNLVFQTNDITKGWDGTFNARPSDVGTYVYMITGTSQKEQVALKGTVELIR